MRQCLGVVKELARKKGGHLFNEPVDPVALGLPDYFEVVEDPLDLGTIQRGIEQGFYLQPDRDGRSGLQRAMDDVAVVWANAILYNPPESPVSALAAEFKAAADAHFARILAEADPAAERALRARHGLGGSNPDQLVMDQYMFLDDAARPVAPEDLLQGGLKGCRLLGTLVRRGAPAAPPHQPPAQHDDVWELRPVAWHFQPADAARGGGGGGGGAEGARETDRQGNT